MAESAVFTAVADAANGVNNKATLSAVQQAWVINIPYYFNESSIIELTKCVTFLLIRKVNNTPESFYSQVFKLLCLN
ncbi:hypothetical protein GCM10009193_25610 [Shewanella aestuarii]|nr:hypothetical protein GCM10009193_25610 [Shewanella aestuarii]